MTQRTAARPTSALPAEWRVEDGLLAHLERGGFKREDYDAARTPVKLLGLTFSVPNPPKHRRAIMMHDLHHVATGYDTTLRGEGEISAWELRNGLRTIGWYAGMYVVGGTAMGYAVAPIRTWRARRAAATGRNFFAGTPVAYEQLLDMTIGELRALLGLPKQGLC